MSAGSGRAAAYATLALLTADDLKDMGIQSIGHRRKLLAAIAELAVIVGAPPPDCPVTFQS